jgi:galactose mutarotase-like enzyme
VLAVAETEIRSAEKVKPYFLAMGNQLNPIALSCLLTGLKRVGRAYSTVWPNTHNAISLTNDVLAVEITPEEGGRISSLESHTTGVEFLTQSGNKAIHLEPGYEAQFQNGACAGIEECLPTVGACDERTSGGAVPDHGDFWQLRWEVIERSSSHVILATKGFSRPLLFEKTVTLNEATLSLRYRIQNIGESATSFLYACHPLLAIEPGDRIALPSEIEALQLTYSRTGRLGEAGDRIGWPGKELDTVLSMETGEAEMFYSGRLRTGRCGLFRIQAKQGLLLSFSTRKLPYLGLWLCYGGWPGGAVPQQYAVAIEPTMAPCNTLKQAQEEGLACHLPPRDVVEWELEFQVTPAGTTWKAFQAAVNETLL